MALQTVGAYAEAELEKIEKSRAAWARVRAFGWVQDLECDMMVHHSGGEIGIYRKCGAKDIRAIVREVAGRGLLVNPEFRKRDGWAGSMFKPSIPAKAGEDCTEAFGCWLEWGPPLDSGQRRRGQNDVPGTLKVRLFLKDVFSLTLEVQDPAALNISTLGQCVYVAGPKDADYRSFTQHLYNQRESWAAGSRHGWRHCKLWFDDADAFEEWLEARFDNFEADLENETAEVTA